MLKAMGACSMWVFISPNMVVAEIYNTFPHELGFFCEEGFAMESWDHEHTSARTRILLVAQILWVY